MPKVRALRPEEMREGIGGMLVTVTLPFSEWEAIKGAIFQCRTDCEVADLIIGEELAKAHKRHCGTGK